MKKIEKQLNKLKKGDIVKIHWGDPSADPVEDGSAEELVDDYVEVQYLVVGWYLGINKKGKIRTAILANEKRIDSETPKKGEFRGKMNIRLDLIYKVEPLQP
jgi:TusA-related sulfurtransferase|tara:strand:+ start:280 stop:585 length:306 start_codon:yes stop_codon:yes gene_type:complete